MMRYLSIKEVAERFNVGYMTIYKLVKDKKIPAVRIGWQWRIPESFLEQGTNIDFEHVEAGQE